MFTERPVNEKSAARSRPKSVPAEPGIRRGVGMLLSRKFDTLLWDSNSSKIFEVTLETQLVKKITAQPRNNRAEKHNLKRRPT